MTNFRVCGIATVFCLTLLFLCISFSAGQDVPATPEEAGASDSDSVEPFKIKVSVTEVSLDVVVLDKKSGNPIADLTAADFEVYQDDKRQKIKSSVYIGSQPNTAERSGPARKENLNLPSPPTASLKKENVSRTILFVVDDYAMTTGNGYYAKKALGNFVEKQMRPGDLVAILRTGYGNSALNMFQSDKREALARINSMPTTTAPRKYDEFLNPFGAHEGMWQNFMITGHENRKATISQGIRALRDMPGRKILIMATPLSVHDDPYALVPENYTYVRSSSDKGFPTTGIPTASDLRTNERIRRYEELYHELADEALRANVVVNLLDVDELYNFSSNYADAQRWLGADATGGREMQPSAALAATLREQRHDPIRPTNPLPAQTGGIIIQDKNFFHDGIGREVENLMKGYYLVSYEPPSNTFETRGRKDVFRRLKVRVNRKDAVVHTRSGFFGRLESEIDAGAPKQHPLVEAIFSPFKHAGLDVNMASGYVKDAKAGYLIRSWIHIDPKDVKIVETKDGGARIELETVCLTSDMNGHVHDLKQLTHTYEIGHENRDENIALIQKHGIRFAMLLPVKKPGNYYVRSAVKDVESGKVGSAYQFIEIPDLDKKGLALSNVFMVTGANDLRWLVSDAAEEIEEGLFFPVFQAEEVRSPALRTYSPGNRVQALAMLYNADDKAAAGAEIEMQYILYRNGEEFRRFMPARVKPSDAGNAAGIPVFQGFTLGADTPPGDYVLQLTATDKKNSKKKEGVATQALGFTVTENRTCETGGAVCAR